MKEILKISILCLLFSSCCRHEPVETARYELTALELALLPYQYGEKISFTHSNGHSFDFTVIEDKLKWEEYHEFCEWLSCPKDYYSYQVKTSILESAYPKFHIELSLGGSRYSDHYEQALNVDFNNNFFTQFSYDSLANFICDSITETAYYDSILLDNKMFFNVVKRGFDNYNFDNDSSVLVPMYIYFNNLGVIQLEMSNNETFTLSN